MLWGYSYESLRHYRTNCWTEIQKYFVGCFAVSDGRRHRKHCHIGLHSAKLIYVSGSLGVGKLPFASWTKKNLLSHSIKNKSFKVGRLEKTTRSSPHHVAQHRPTGSETTPPYAPRSSRFGSEPPSVEDDVDVWRYTRNDDDEGHWKRRRSIDRIRVHVCPPL